MYYYFIFHNYSAWLWTLTFDLKRPIFHLRPSESKVYRRVFLFLHFKISNYLCIHLSTLVLTFFASKVSSTAILKGLSLSHSRTHTRTISISLSYFLSPSYFTPTFHNLFFVFNIFCLRFDNLNGKIDLQVEKSTKNS